MVDARSKNKLGNKDDYRRAKGKRNNPPREAALTMAAAFHLPKDQLPPGEHSVVKLPCVWRDTPENLRRSYWLVTTIPARQRDFDPAYGVCRFEFRALLPEIHEGWFRVPEEGSQSRPSRAAESLVYG